MRKSIINILGITVDRIEASRIDSLLENFIFSHKQHYIVTPNPEIILKAMSDEELFYILNHADLSLPDGMGLKLASLAVGENINRYTGADLVKNIFNIAERKGSKTLIANWEGSISPNSILEKSIREKWPKIQLQVITVKKENYRLGIDHNTLKQIAEYNPVILVTNLGAPLQEKFIYHIQKFLPSVKLAIGIGGALDFITGKMRRAPKIFRSLGLEWLYRLFQEPWRARRIINAVFVFPYQFLIWKYLRPYLYRPNVACLLYKIEKGKVYILIVEREDSPGHWQIPQGGTDGQDLMSAGYHELSHEINCDDFEPEAAFKNLYKYCFARKLDEKAQKHKMRGYKGQKQGLYIARFTGNDSDIQVNFWEHRDWKWVEADNLVEEVHPARREATGIFLEKFIQLIKK